MKRYRTFLWYKAHNRSLFRYQLESNQTFIPIKYHSSKMRIPACDRDYFRISINVHYQQCVQSSPNTRFPETGKKYAAKIHKNFNLLILILVQNNRISNLWNCNTWNQGSSFTNSVFRDLHLMYSKNTIPSQMIHYRMCTSQLLPSIANILCQQINNLYTCITSKKHL